MDLRAYYREVREVQRSFTEPFVVVVSEKTQDGGRAGVKSEVTTEIAARLIVDGKARAATAEETEGHRKEQAEQYAAAQRQARLLSVMCVHEVEKE